LRYICAIDAATGFYFQNGKWGEASFRHDRKFIVAKQENDEWQLTEVGEKFSMANYGKVQRQARFKRCNFLYRRNQMRRNVLSKA
jgi:hypothetical protein